MEPLFPDSNAVLIRWILDCLQAFESEIYPKIQMLISCLFETVNHILDFNEMIFLALVSK